MMTNWFGIATDAGGNGHIPHSVRLSFYIGAAAFLGAVLWTVFSTKEYPPTELELKEIRARKFDWTLGLGDIFALVFHLPRRMWELGLVQFFTWIGMFSMWVYFSPAVAKGIFHATPGSPEMEASGAWSGFCFAAYNAVCFVFSFVLLWATKYTGPKLMHVVCLAIGGLGLAAVSLATDKHQLLISMAAVGIAWSSILSMPYAMLAPALPQGQGRRDDGHVQSVHRPAADRRIQPAGLCPEKFPAQRAGERARPRRRQHGPRRRCSRCWW